MKILISAAEVSADHHGARLLAALRETAPPGERVEAFGLAGPALAAEGCDVVVGMEGLRAMGTFEVLGKIPAFRRALARLAEVSASRGAEIAVFLDSPDFQFRLAPRLGAIPKAYYIPPKVWVWRKARAIKLRQMFDRILCIFPFEVAGYREGSGGEAVYVGNPLLDELPWSETRESARARLKLSAAERVLLVMPGSRPTELKLHLELTGGTVRKFAERSGEAWTVLLPLSSEADRASVNEWARSLPGVRVSVGNAHDCMLAADLGLIKSGTSTLEAALLGCPHVLFYRPHWITAFLFHRVLGYRNAIGLVNWIAGRDKAPFLVPEVVSERATPEILSGELLTLWRQGRPAMREAFAGIRQALRTEESPSRHAAREIWKLYFERRHRAEVGAR